MPTNPLFPRSTPLTPLGMRGARPRCASVTRGGGSGVGDANLRGGDAMPAVVDGEVTVVVDDDDVGMSE
jgi:hypothetical protein